jgi:hypothetical protein
MKLIDFYKPKFWYIENPKTSLMWKYIKLNCKKWLKNDYHFNVTSYGKYGFLIRKDTIFLSNIKMNLQYGKTTPPYHIEYEQIEEKYFKNKFCIKKNNQCFRKWYVQNGHSFKEGKKYATLFPKDAGLGVLQKKDNRHQKNKMSNEQICESGSVSSIPSPLIKDIFKHFK